MKILHIAYSNNDPEIQPNMGPKCNPVGGEPPTHGCLSFNICTYKNILDII